MTVVVTMPIPDRKLSPNVTVGSRGQRMGKAKKIKDYRTRAKLEFWAKYSASFRPKWRVANCTLKWFAKTRAFPDGDNALATMKPAFDGLTDAGLFADDKGLTHSPIEFAKDPVLPRVEIHITRYEPNMTLPEFKAALKSHDWFYHMADDPRAYREGAARDQELRSIATKGDPEYKVAFNAAYAVQHHRAPAKPPYIFPFPEVLKS